MCLCMWLRIADNRAQSKCDLISFFIVESVFSLRTFIFAIEAWKWMGKEINYEQKKSLMVAAEASTIKAATLSMRIFVEFLLLLLFHISPHLVLLFSSVVIPFVPSHWILLSLSLRILPYTFSCCLSRRSALFRHRIWRDSITEMWETMTLQAKLVCLFPTLLS